MQRLILIAIAGALVLIGAAAFGGYLFFRPNVLRVAVGPAGSDDYKLMVAAAQVAAREGSLRLRLVAQDGPSTAAQALERGDADLAVVRSDEAMPSNGLTAVILHRNAAVLIAPGRSPLRHVSDLKGRTVGIVGPVAPNEHLLDTTFQQYGVPTQSVRRLPIAQADITKLLLERRIDAVLAVGVASSGVVPETVAAVASASPAQPIFLPVDQAEAIAQRERGYESFQIVVGMFGGSPPRPTKEFDTLSVSYRLVARNSLRDALVGQITSLFFSDRQSLAALAPLADRIQAPSTEKGSALPVHPGAAAYLDDEEETFLDRYSDFIYIGAMLLSVIGSGFAAVASRLSGQPQPVFEAYLRRLVEMVAAARSAATLRALKQLEEEADFIVGKTMGRAAASVEANRIAALAIGLEHLRAAIGDRRRLILEAGPEERATSAQIIPLKPGQPR
jgi:TRAP transporter TAXI family solute receptor